MEEDPVIAGGFATGELRPFRVVVAAGSGLSPLGRRSSGYDTLAMSDPLASLATPYRTHTCGALRATDAARPPDSPAGSIDAATTAS